MYPIGIFLNNNSWSPGIYLCLTPFTISWFIILCTISYIQDLCDFCQSWKRFLFTYTNNGKIFRIYFPIIVKDKSPNNHIVYSVMRGKAYFLHNLNSEWIFFLKTVRINIYQLLNQTHIFDDFHYSVTFLKRWCTHCHYGFVNLFGVHRNTCWIVVPLTSLFYSNVW